MKVLDDRFWSKVNRTEGCWLWTASTNQGYGQFRLDGTMHLAHRLTFVETYGPIPAATPHLDHLCRTPRCVRPAHLEAVTQRENNRRTIRDLCRRGHGRWVLKSNGHRQCRECLTITQREARHRARA